MSVPTWLAILRHKKEQVWVRVPVWEMKMVFGLWPFVLNVVPDDSIPANSVQDLMMRFRDIWSVLHHPEQFGFLPTRKRCAAFQQWPDWFGRHAVLNSKMIACFKVVRAQWSPYVFLQFQTQIVLNGVICLVDTLICRCVCLHKTQITKFSRPDFFQMTCRFVAVHIRIRRLQSTL